MGALLTEAANAGYDASAWPSWATNNLRDGKPQSADNYSSVVERAQAANVDLPAAPSWWRSQRANLEQWKTWLNENTDEFIDYTQADDDGTFTNWFAQGHADFPRLDPVRVAELAKLPTNVLDASPWRCLNGRGPFTNDVPAVGHPHGWTNATTAAGGTNFPAGREVWYTTDYVRPAITSYVAHLRWTATNSEPPYVGSYDVVSSGTNATTVPPAYDSQGNLWPYSVKTNWAFGEYNYMVEADFEGDPGQAKKYLFVGNRSAPTGGVRVSGISTACQHSVQHYMAFDFTWTDPGLAPPWYDDPRDIDGLIDYIDPTNVVMGHYYFIEDASESETATHYSEEIEAAYTNMVNPVPVRWPAAPSTNEWMTTSGMEGSNSWWLLKWDGANGFDYK